MKPAAYTVFRADGSIRMIHGVIPAFVRTLRAARALAESGDTIQAWGSAGQPLTKRAVR